MKRVAVIVLGGLVFAFTCLGVAYAADGALFHAHWIRDIFIGPPLFVVERILPTLSSTLAQASYTPSRRAIVFVATAILFWWVIGAAGLLLISKRNNA